VREAIGWSPEIGLKQLLGEIADHAIANPEWLSWCGS
jgi:hypothetical protein